MPFPTNSHSIPLISTEQMVEVDRLMIEEYRIELIQMMENAGRGLAKVAKHRFLKDSLEGKNVVVMAGTGGNGGGALVAARRLHSWGANVRVFLSSSEEKFTPIPSHQLGILKNMGLNIQSWDHVREIEEADLILDGIIGYSIKGDPRGLVKEMIEWANDQAAPILSLDTPSGLNLTSGRIGEPTIKAMATLTLALPKKGLYDEAASKFVGELYLADISVPPQLYAQPSLGLTVSPEIFLMDDVVRLV